MKDYFGLHTLYCQSDTHHIFLPDKKMILFVCEGDGMTTGVAGMTTENVANIMKTLGCTDAINLDGGGSSCMLVNGQETIKTSDSSGDERSVASVVTLK